MNGFSSWHWYPFYSGVLIIAFYFYRSRFGRVTLKEKLYNRISTEKFTPPRVFIVMFLGVFFSLGFSLVFPVGEIDEPEGSFYVGTQTYELEDMDRLEEYGENEDQRNRRLKVQVWYPAESVEGMSRALWIPEGRRVSRNLARIFYFPPFMLDQSEEVLSNSYLNAPISKEHYHPVIILSHGWSGFRTLHTDFGELLASHGFVVFGIDHTYGAPVVIFEDGEEILIDGNALPYRSDPEFLSAANRFLGTYAEDILFLLDLLENRDTSCFDQKLVQQLNVRKIGLLGHSTGGGAAVEVALTDERVMSLMGLDPWVEPLNSNQVSIPLEKPFLFLRSEEWENHENNENLYEVLNSGSKGLAFDIEGTTHVDFTMIHLYSPITSLVGLTGTIERERFEEIQENLILQFFFQTLVEEKLEADLSEFVDKYDELRRILP